jgi:hypothetical protein
MRRHILITFSMLALLVASAPPALGFMEWSGELLPDGDQRPVVETASLALPQRHNDILEADLTIEATDNDRVIGYEYRWIGMNVGSTFASDLEKPTVSYRSVNPDSHQTLQVRAIDSNGWRSDWFSAWTGITPSPPNLIVAGDSIASGYTRQWFTSQATCVDATASYGSTVRDGIASSLPASWAPTYRNVAWAGAGVHAMAGGGVDSCGVTHQSQVAAIEAATDETTWNIVVVTAGINSTNWSTVMVDLTRNTAFSFTERGDKAWCDIGLSQRWNIGQRAAGITTAVRGISSTLRTKTNADVYWTSYYGITNTRLAPGWTPIGSECDEEMSGALDRLHSAIRAGLDGSVTWVDVAGSKVPTQGWAGWPHPNADGQRVIGDEVSATIG